MFHNLRGYDSHLIFKELSKFNCKIMSFTLNGNIVYIDSVLFMNSSLDKLAKNLGSEDFEYLSEVFSGEKLELVKKNIKEYVMVGEYLKEKIWNSTMIFI